jgi:tRNA nucleotidyltransferase (CCA-adding enzyme)
VKIPGVRSLLTRVGRGELRRALECAREAASHRAEALYLVGGCVRDVILGIPLRDLDLVVEGDPSGLGRAIASALDGQSHRPTRFGTCRVDLPEGSRIDLAMSRTERYPAPATLPQVAPAPIEEDLLRRDFTVNALAIGLTGPCRMLLLDPTTGIADLRARRLRPLHRRTLLDDPTRALRGARYARRLGLRDTADWRKALSAAGVAGAFRRLSPSRIQRELLLLWREPDPGACLSLCHRWGVLRRIHPRLGWDPALHAAVARASRMGGSAGARRQDLLFALLACSLHPGSRRSFCRRVALSGERSRRVLEAATAPRRAAELVSPGGRGGKNVSVALNQMEELAGWSPLSRDVAIAALDAVTRRRVERCLKSWEKLTPELGGEDLVVLGIPRGPEIGKALRALRAARAAGEVLSRRDEITFMRSLGLGRPS